MELSMHSVTYKISGETLHITREGTPWRIFVHDSSRQGEQTLFMPLYKATIETETEDGITGRAWCSRCGGSVCRSSNYCQHCGVRFGERQGDMTCRDM